MRIFKPIETLLRNVRDSFLFSIKGIYKTQQNRKLDDDLILEYILYGNISYNKRPIIKTQDETIKTIVTTDRSLVRFGDGEIVIADGGGIPFQKADKALAKRLQEILANKNEQNLIVTLSREYYYPDIAKILREQNELRKNVKLYEMPKLRRRVDKYINYSAVYYDGIHREYGGGDRFVVWREFFKDKKLVLVGCKEAFDSYQFNLFDTAKELVYEYTPNKHAFSKYDEILARLLNYDKKFIHILMCGPTSKVLVADLTKDGFRALDLGHLAKDYDWYYKGIDIYNTTSQNVAKFVSPDE